MHSQTGSPLGGRPRAAAAAPLDPAADLRLVAQVLAGRPGAEEELVDRLACLPAMIRVQHRRLGNLLPGQELDDVVQNVLLALWRKLGQYDGRVPVLFWAAGFGSVELRKAIDRRRRRPEVSAEGRGEPPAPATDVGIDAERVRLSLAELDPDGREIVRQKHFEGRTFDEIAAQTGTVVNTVKTRYYRALERLRGWWRRSEAGAGDGLVSRAGEGEQA